MLSKGLFVYLGRGFGVSKGGVTKDATFAIDHSVQQALRVFGKKPEVVNVTEVISR